MDAPGDKLEAGVRSSFGDAQSEEDGAQCALPPAPVLLGLLGLELLLLHNGHALNQGLRDRVRASILHPRLAKAVKSFQTSTVV